MDDGAPDDPTESDGLIETVGPPPESHGRSWEAERAMGDGRDRLWTPHRMAYIKGENKPTNPDSKDECPFCRIPHMSDADGLIVARGEHVYAVLNLYPYNSGHMLICPYRHIADYTELTQAEAQEQVHFGQMAMRAVRRAMAPAGFNLGTNQGDVAGAGIAAHLHQHVVPRWQGDTNFMPLVAHTRILPQELSDTRGLIATAWREIENEAEVGAQALAAAERTSAAEVTPAAEGTSAAEGESHAE